MRVLRGSLAVLLLLVAGRTADAALITFDFESLATGTYASLSDTVSGLTITVTRTVATSFDLADITPGGPAGFGDRTLSPFISLPAGDSFVVDFSAPILSFSAEFGDFGPSDDDTPVTATAYTGLGGTGLVVDTDLNTWIGSDSFPAFKTLSMSGLGINSVVFTSAGPFTNSLFWDNFVVETEIPEPASMTLFGLGALGLAGYRARRRQTAV